jgi:peptidoglycan/xylan/chitin deacetylase (PgdA/CDA1 family)
MIVPRAIRHHLKNAAPQMVRWSVMGKKRAAAGRATILCYHSINRLESGLSIDPQSFREQIGMLRSHGYCFMTMGQFVEKLTSDLLPPQPIAVLTFDDGYADNYTQLLPILQEFGISATVYVTTGLLMRDPATADAMRKLTGYAADFLNADQLRGLHAAGVEIGAHTVTHRNLAKLADSDARDELFESKKALEEILGAPVQHFAYPFGKRMIHYSLDTVRLVRETGFRSAAAVAFRRAGPKDAKNLFELPRFFVNRADSLAHFEEKACGCLDWLGRYHQLSPAWLKGLVSPEEQKYE